MPIRDRLGQSRTAPEEMSLLELKAVKHSLYFRDGVRKIDAILVYDSNIISEVRKIFLNNLKSQELQIEEENSEYIPGRVYVKVHAPENILKKNAKKHGIPTKYEEMTVLSEPTVPYECLKTILNDPRPNPQDPIAKRAWPTISKQKPTTFTFNERNTIVFTMMQYTKFGNEPFKVGLSQLVLKGYFIGAYPLHDGQWQWPENDSEPLNDRQLLAKYWANFGMWYKQQPLNTIEQYFGPEIAIYFGWLGFYNKMLIIAAVMGVCTFLYGIVNISFIVSKPIEEACESEIYICPPCRSCKPKQLKSFCTYFKIASLNDNFASVLFACAMSFWATFFMEFWKRRYSTLIIRWNLQNAMNDVYRPEFQETATDMRVHEYTGEMELYIPMRKQIFKYTMSISIVIFMILIVLTTIFTIILYECIMKMYGIGKIYVSLSSAVMTLAVMMTLRKIYGSIAMWLTGAENPRTQLEFDKSYMIKMAVFSMINNYGKLIYIAFFKGKFFTYPGDKRIRSHAFPLSAEVCDPTGCVFEVFILLATITILKPIISNCVEILSPMAKVWIHYIKKRVKISNKHLQTWEQDFDLNSANHFRMLEELEEMVMQYGFVTLLVAAFPLAPLLALINNIFEIRIDSTKLVKYFRRNEASKTTSISVWFDTIQALTYFAVITNALFITFTSNFIPVLVYILNYKRNLAGFVEFRLSKFKVTDHYWHYWPSTNETMCYYPGHRYPPESNHAYEYTYLHFYILSCRLGFAIVFTLLVLGLTAIMAYAIPDMPSGIRDLLAYNARKLRESSAA